MIKIQVNTDKKYRIIDTAEGDVPQVEGEWKATLPEAISSWMHPGDPTGFKPESWDIEEVSSSKPPIEMYDGSMLIMCEACGKEFPNYGKGTPPKKCPSCKDKEQERPSIVQSRRMLHEYKAVLVESMPVDWVEIAAQHHGDSVHYKQTVKGEQYGASWSGRIDIFASEPFKAGDVVNVREMCSEHKVRVVTRGGYKTFHEGLPYTREEIVPITQDVQITATEFPNKGDVVGVEDVIRQRRYFVLERAPEGTQAQAKLVYVTAKTKTTIKGFGRQYWAEANADATIAHWQISGGVRSGRAHTTGVLAIVSEEHPLYVKKTGDIEGEECYK